MKDESTQCSKKQQANAINEMSLLWHRKMLFETMQDTRRLLALNEKIVDFLINPRASITEDDL